MGEKVKRRIMTAGMLAMMLAMGMTGCGKSDTKIDEATKTEQTSETDSNGEKKQSDNEANVMNDEQNNYKLGYLFKGNQESVQCRRRAKDCRCTGSKEKIPGLYIK